MIKQLKVKKQREALVKIKLILILLLTHVITYYGTRIFTTDLHHYNMTTFMDNSIPFLPWTIVIWYKALSVVMANLVFVSTLTTKQHVIVDVVAGVLLAEIGYMISGIITGAENEQSNVNFPEAR